MALTNRQRYYYSLPSGVMALLYGGPLVVLQGIYAKYYGLSLGEIASILLIARLFDTITDPIVGFYSDQYHARKGTRKPFVFWGAIVFIVGAYGLFMPPDRATSAYILSFFLIYYLGFTLFNVPHYAWGNDISSTTQDSIRTYTVRSLLIAVGTLVFYSIPQLPFFAVKDFTPETLQWALIVCGLLLSPAIVLCIFYVPDSHESSDMAFIKNNSRINPTNESSGHKSLGVLKTIKRNKPLLIFLSGFFLWNLGLGSFGGLLFIYIDSYLGVGDQFSMVALIGVGCSILGVKIWSVVALRVGKIKAWMLSTMVMMSSLLLMLLLVPDNPNAFFLIMLMVLIFLGSISTTIFAPALLSDIIDYSTWKFGQDFAASYFSIFFLIMKANDALGAAIGLSIVGWFGFNLSNKVHDSESVMGLQMAAIWLPVFFLLMSVFLIYKIPINTRRHTIICKALARRRSREPARI